MLYTLSYNDKYNKLLYDAGYFNIGFIKPI